MLLRNKFNASKISCVHAWKLLTTCLHFLSTFQHLRCRENTSEQRIIAKAGQSLRVNLWIQAKRPELCERTENRTCYLLVCRKLQIFRKLQYLNSTLVSPLSAKMIKIHMQTIDWSIHPAGVVSNRMYFEMRSFSASTFKKRSAESVIHIATQHWQTSFFSFQFSLAEWASASPSCYPC